MKDSEFERKDEDLDLTQSHIAAEPKGEVRRLHGEECEPGDEERSPETSSKKDKNDQVVREMYEQGRKSHAA